MERPGYRLRVVKLPAQHGARGASKNRKIRRLPAAALSSQAGRVQPLPLFGGPGRAGLGQNSGRIGEEKKNRRRTQKEAIPPHARPELRRRFTTAKVRATAEGTVNRGRYQNEIRSHFTMMEDFS